MKRLRVLVVDDTIVYRKIVSEVLSEVPGIEVVGTANNGKIAMARIASLKPDLITLDIEMPEMNGLDLLRKIKQFNGMIQVIIITGYLTINNTLNSFRYGAEDLFFKPFDLNEVVQAVDACAKKLDRVNLLVSELAEYKGY